MEKNNKYWNIHKIVYMEELDKLDSSIANEIQSKPYSKEAHLFNEKVENKIEEKLNQVASL